MRSNFWSQKQGRLIKRFEFSDYDEALQFVVKVSMLAEKVDHHPDISFGWGYAEITLTTHSEGKITSKDTELAELIDKIN